MKNYQMYINGTFTDSVNHTTYEVTSPASGKVIATVPAGSQSDVDIVTEKAQSAFQSWKKTPSIERAQYISKLIELMRNEDHQKVIGQAMANEMGKPLNSAIGEVSAGADLAEYQNQWARRIEGDIVDSDASNERILMYKEPLGAVLCIVPWNFPIYVLMRKLIPALVAGNTVIIKPSVKSPTSALELAKLFEKAGFPQGVVHVITGRDEEIGDALTSSDKINMITFTGSTKVGKHIASKASENVTRTSLELGGKAPAIVMNDADLDLAVQAIAGGRLANSGQVCSNTERVYVQSDIKSEFINKMKKEFESYKVGDGIEDPNVPLGPLISENDGIRVHSMVQDAVNAGAKVITGGNFIDSMPKSFYNPTLLDECNQDMEIVREEIFGPILPVVSFETIDEAIELANDTVYGLTSNIYTKDYRSVMKLTTEIEAGEVYVNRQQGEAFQGFHAGWKQSGTGGDDGRHGFEEFLQIKTVYLNF